MTTDQRQSIISILLYIIIIVVYVVYRESCVPYATVFMMLAWFAGRFKEHF